MAEPRRFNSEACDLKHRSLNARVKGNEEGITELTKAVITLTTIQENQESNTGGWINTPAGLIVLKVGIIMFVVLLTIATGINIMQFMT